MREWNNEIPQTAKNVAYEPSCLINDQSGTLWIVSLLEWCISNTNGWKAVSWAMDNNYKSQEKLQPDLQ